MLTNAHVAVGLEGMRARVGDDSSSETPAQLVAAAPCEDLAVVRLVNPMADSPMETRIRFALVQAGLPCPVLQHPVGPYLLDLAYPDLKLAIEYDGREHLIPERALHDLHRQAYLTRAVMIASKSLSSPS